MPRLRAYPSSCPWLGTVALLCLLAPSTASAQVNTEKLRSWETAGFSGGTDFAFAFRTGNVALLTIGTGVRLQYATLHEDTGEDKKLKTLLYLVSNLNFGEKRRQDEAPRDRFINNGFVHLRWTNMWLWWLGTEVFGQSQYNQFIRLQRRLLGGIGLRVAAIENENAEIHVGSAYMFENELIDLPDGGRHGQDPTLTNPDAIFHRWTNYLSVKLYMAEPKLTVVNTVYIQPRLSDFGDYRLINDAEISVTVADFFDVVWALSLRYDSDPPLDAEGEPLVKRLDTTFTHKIRLAF